MQPPRALEWLRPSAFGLDCDGTGIGSSTGGGAFAASPLAAVTLPMGVEGFLEVGARGAVVLHWRSTFGSESADSAAAAAAEAKGGGVGFGICTSSSSWQVLRGSLGDGDELVSLCAVTADSESFLAISACLRVLGAAFSIAVCSGAAGDVSKGSLQRCRYMECRATENSGSP